MIEVFDIETEYVVLLTSGAIDCSHASIKKLNFTDLFKCTSV